MSRRRRVVTVAAIAVAAAAGLSGCRPATHDSADSADPADKVRTVVLDVRYSAFSTDTLTVRAGELVRFVVRNHDPIPHELIVGDQSVQDVHELGTESHHGDRPGEASVGPGKTATTTYRFGSAGAPVIFGCHLPGHWAYGMRGTIEVR